MNETFCQRCLKVVKRTVAGACVACGFMVAAPATGVATVAGPLPGQAAISPSSLASAEGPHSPEQDFMVHVPGARYGGTAATITTRFADGGAAVDTLQVTKTGAARTA